MARRLAAHADFRTEDGDELSWWGRELTEMERESALAQIRSLGEDEPIEEPDEPQRWLRGRLAPHPEGFEVSVNSEERLQALTELLHGLGAEPELARRSVIDPAQDMPPSRLGMPMPFGASQDAVDAWQSTWAGERVPALGGATPRTASRRAQSRPRLEAVLREFEHDAYVLARAGRPLPIWSDCGQSSGWSGGGSRRRTWRVGPERVSGPASPPGPPNTTPYQRGGGMPNGPNCGLTDAFVRRAGFNTPVVRPPFDRGVPVPLTRHSSRAPSLTAPTSAAPRRSGYSKSLKTSCSRSSRTRRRCESAASCS